VLANVLINAAEARSGAGDRPVHVDLGASLEAPGGRPVVHLRVNDDGCGMTPETLARAFENGFTTKGASLGLGLHWCANAVHAMGGRMYAESPGPGQGTCIHLLLPAVNGKGGH
jgi:C4-dicarboxylate-specific signal transduction histidine kinase